MAAAEPGVPVVTPVRLPPVRPRLDYSADPWLLRGLLRCRSCELWMATTVVADQVRTAGGTPVLSPRRVYRCGLRCHGDRVVDAAAVEDAVVDAAGRRAAVAALHRTYLASALRQLLAAAVVSSADAGDVEVRWRR